MATAEAANGGEVVYVLDKRAGLLALVVWNNQTRRPEAVDIKPVQNFLAPRRPVNRRISEPTTVASHARGGRHHFRNPLNRVARRRG